jgi:hypothetical protein
MNLQEQIRKVLKEETNQGKYTNALEDLTEVYKNEDCVCDIKISYIPEEFRDLYLINVVIGIKELNSKFKGIQYQVRSYTQQLRKKITDEVLAFIPIPFLVTFSDTPRCKDYKNLKESKIVDKFKNMLGKKPPTKDDKLVNLIAKFIEENYSIDFESDTEGDITFYLTNDTGNWIFPPIMKYFPTKKLLNYNWKFAEDIHDRIGDDRLLQPDSEMVGKIFEKLFNKKVNKVFGYSRL